MRAQLRIVLLTTYDLTYLLLNLNCATSHFVGVYRISVLKRIDLKQNDIGAISTALSAASLANADVEQTVRAIINDVKVRGDDALCHYAEKFDGFIFNIGEILLINLPTIGAITQPAVFLIAENC